MTNSGGVMDLRTDGEGEEGEDLRQLHQRRLSKETVSISRTE